MDKRFLFVIAPAFSLLAQAGYGDPTSVAVSTTTSASANHMKAMKAAASKEPDAIAVNLGSPEARERGQAAQALGRLGSAAESNLPALAEALTDFSSYSDESGTHMVSLDAAQAMTAIDPKAAVPSKALTRLVHAATAAAGQRTVTGGWIAHCGRQSDALTTLSTLGPLAQDALPELARAHFNPCTEGRALATAMAIGSPAPEQLPRLVNELNDPDAEVRRSVAQYLGDAHVAAATEALGRSLNDASIPVRLEALAALEKLHPEGEGRLPLVKPYLQNDSPEIRRQAIRLLTQLAPEAPATVALLNAQLIDSDPSIVLESAQAILKVHPHDAEGIDALIGLTKDTESETGFQAAELLKASGRHSAAIDEALAPYREQERRQLIEKAILSSTPEERAGNARTLRVQAIRIAKGLQGEEPDHAGRVFAASSKRLVCWTEVSVSTAPAVVNHVWFLDNKPVYAATLVAGGPVSRVWSSRRIKPGHWRVEVSAPGSTEPLASASFTVIK